MLININYLGSHLDLTRLLHLGDLRSQDHQSDPEDQGNQLGLENLWTQEYYYQSSFSDDYKI